MMGEHCQKNIDEILIDHAHCELKAASMENSLIMNFPEYSDLVTEMVALVKEEMSHFNMVHERILKSEITLGHNRKEVDKKWNDLLNFEANLMKDLGTQKSIHGWFSFENWKSILNVKF